MQTVFPFTHQPSYARADYIRSASNEHAFGMMEQWPTWPAYGLILIGAKASGKTHLANIWSARANAQKALPYTPTLKPKSTHHILVDDADMWAGKDQETALFHLLNLTKEQQGNILLTACAPPSEWPIALPDLKSRLNSLPQVTLDAPDENLLSALLAKHFSDMQLHVEHAVIQYIITRVERSFAAIQAVAEAMNHYALEKKRPVTIALVRDYWEQQQS